MSNYMQNNIPSTGSDLGVSAVYFNSVEQANIHPFYMRKIVQPFGNQRLTSYISENSTPSTRPAATYFHNETERFQQPIYVQTTIAAAGAGLPVTITIQPASLVGTKSPLAVGFQILFNDDSVGQITAIPAENTFTIEPALSTQTISVTAGEALVFFPVSNVTEGSCAGNSGLRKLPVLFNNSMQQVRLDETITDEAYASFSEEVTFFDWAGADGNSYKCWTSATLKDRETQFHNGIEMTALTGLQFTNGNLTGDGFRGTNGVLPIIRQYGNVIPYFGNAGVQVTDFEFMMTQAIIDKAPKSYIVSAGVDFVKDANKALKDYFINGAVTYGNMGGEGNSLSWGFDSYKFMGVTLNFQTNETFNDPSFLGAAGYNYRGSAVCMPTEKMVKGNANVNYVELVRLQGQCSPVLGYQHYVVDGTGMLQNSYFRPTSCRKMTFTWFDQIGVEVFAARHLYMFQKG